MTRYLSPGGPKMKKPDGRGFLSTNLNQKRQMAQKGWGSLISGTRRNHKGGSEER